MQLVLTKCLKVTVVPISIPNAPITPNMHTKEVAKYVYVHRHRQRRYCCCIKQIKNKGDQSMAHS